MKIGILTFANSYNYGAALQAYATYQVFQSYGHQIEFINYRNKEEENAYSTFGYVQNFGWRGNLRKIFNHLFLHSKQYDKKAFDKFFALIPLSEKFSKEALKTIDKKKCYDLVVIGSDQVWNPIISGGGTDYTFFGNFTNSPIMSFASSCGSHIYSEQEAKEVIPLLNRFSSITVREEFLKSQLKRLGLTKRIDCILDPTLIINRKLWEQEIDKYSSTKIIPDKPYLLVYLVILKYEKCYEAIRKIAKKMNLKIALIDRLERKKEGVDYYFRTATPFDFVNLIQSATLVFTDSFHGTAFSINMNTPFFVVDNGNPKRITDLLEKLQSQQRMIYKLEEFMYIDEKLDFNKINKVIQKEQQRTRDIIGRCLD